MRIPGSGPARSALRAVPDACKLGIDVLEQEKFAPLRGKHIGLITNHTGQDALGRSTIDQLSHAPGVQLVALFSPEHGLAGRNDEEHRHPAKTPPPASRSTASTATRAVPPTKCCKDLDALVFDVQDAGVRFYTYTTTMAYCMEEAAKRHIAFYVLDRPNPLGGEIIEGPTLDADKTAFVAYYPIPIRYGLTIGELAEFFNHENHIDCDLARDRDEELASQLFFREHRHPLDSAFAESPHAERVDRLSGA